MFKKNNWGTSNAGISMVLVDPALMISSETEPPSLP